LSLLPVNFFPQKGHQQATKTVRQKNEFVNPYPPFLDFQKILFRFFHEQKRKAFNPNHKNRRSGKNHRMITKSWVEIVLKKITECLEKFWRENKKERKKNGEKKVEKKMA